MPQFLPTKNEEWGFYGSIKREYGLTRLEANAAYRSAFAPISKRMGWTKEQIRNFLDSDLGRHFADRVTHTPVRWVPDPEEASPRVDLDSLLKAIEKTVESVSKGWFTPKGHSLGFLKTENFMRSFPMTQINEVGGVIDTNLLSEE